MGEGDNSRSVSRSDKMAAGKKKNQKESYKKCRLAPPPARPRGNYISRYNPFVLLRNLRPIRLSRRIDPFDSDQFIFELKIDGFRALAHIENGKGELSRNGNVAGLLSR
jgi:ATP-dependent DNA ligase